MRRVEPDADQMAEQFADLFVVRRRQRRLQQRVDIGLEVRRAPRPEQHDIDARLVPDIAIAGVDDAARAAFMDEEAQGIVVVGEGWSTLVLRKRNGPPPGRERAALGSG